VGFTVIVRGACRFALVVAIFVLAFIVLFGLPNRAASAASSPVALLAPARAALAQRVAERGGDTAFFAASHRFTTPTVHESFHFAPSASLCFLDGVRDGFFQIPDAFLQLAFGLLLQPPRLLLLAPHQLPGFFLDLAAEVLQFAFNLILVWGDCHDHFLNG
jgi:hypothetical protein